MLKLSEEEKKFITDNLDPLLVETTELNDILDPLDEWIAVNGFDDNYDLTDEGRKAQRIYDSIYYNNI